MSVDTRKAFHELLRDEFAPRLRELDFKGSGSDFRRVRGEVINTVNIQGRRQGGSSAVNIGLHLTFLPLGGKGQLPDVAKIREIDCEFRRRLAPKGKSDYWWKHGGLFKSTSGQVAHLIETYLQVGEPAFSQYDTVDRIAEMISIDDISSGAFANAFGEITRARAALAMARIHRHLGNSGLAAAFATAGLENVGRAVALKPELQKILDGI